MFVGFGCFYLYLFIGGEVVEEKGEHMVNEICFSIIIDP